MTLRFSISDTGIGIPRASINKLFIPFSQVDGSTTRRFGGTGLGLAISKQLIELMEGMISVESTEEKGTTFYFFLPLEPADDTQTESYVDNHNVDTVLQVRPDGHILIVDDADISLKVMEKLLQKLGLTSSVVSSGEQALKELREHDYNLVLMDCTMPVLDGYETTALIRDPATGVKNPQIPVIAMTARAMQGDRDKCLKASMNDYLSKPVYCKELIMVLNRWLDKECS
jgi:CheY-like chemotaxis protein